MKMTSILSSIANWFRHKPSSPVTSTEKKLAQSKPKTQILDKERFLPDTDSEASECSDIEWNDESENEDYSPKNRLYSGVGTAMRNESRKRSQVKMAIQSHRNDRSRSNRLDLSRNDSRPCSPPIMSTPGRYLHVDAPTQDFSPHPFYSGGGDYQRSSVKRREKEPMRFNGKTDWSDYMRHFEAVAQWNRWDDSECGLQLAICLIDEAREVLSSLPRHLQNDYNSLIEALTSRYSPSGKEAQYAYELMNRTCKPEESVTAFGQALRRLASKAYSDQIVDDKILLNLFIKGLPEKSMQKHVHFSKPTSLADAISCASEYESFDKPTEVKSSVRTQKPRDTMIASVDQIDSTSVQKNDFPKLKSLDGALAQTLCTLQNTLKNLDCKIEKLEAGTRAPTGAHQMKKTAVKCYFCHEDGHYARDCPKKRTSDNNTSRDSSGGARHNSLN